MSLNKNKEFKIFLESIKDDNSVTLIEYASLAFNLLFEGESDKTFVIKAVVKNNTYYLRMDDNRHSGEWLQDISKATKYTKQEALNQIANAKHGSDPDLDSVDVINTIEPETEDRITGDRETIREHMAKAYWATSWADYQEQELHKSFMQVCHVKTASC